MIIGGIIILVIIIAIIIIARHSIAKNVEIKNINDGDELIKDLRQELEVEKSYDGKSKSKK